ncbi:MAG: AAA family ATPase [Actinomycetota bacterium]|nr:AAA family ATPase [Actinomycetota bacterium]
MRLKRIRLEDYRGIDVSEVEFLDTGVTIVQGPNEAGKSSIAEAIDIVLDFADSSSDRRVKALKPTHRDAGPSIEVEMDVGAYSFVYRKRYLRGKETLLTITAPKNESLTGREAHDRVRSILSENLDEALWRALRVHQGVKIDQAAMAEAVSLGAALDRAAGAVTPAGEAEVTLLEAARAEYKRYFSESGRPGRLLGDARFEVDSADAEVQKWTDELTAIEDDVARSLRLATEVEMLTRRRLEAESVVRTREQRWAEVLELTTQVETLRAQMQHAVSIADNARERLEIRRQLVDSVADARRERSDLESAVSARGPSLAALSAQRAELTEASEVAEARLTAARSALQVAERDLEFRRDELDLQLLSERHVRIEESRKALALASATLDGLTVDAPLLERIRAQHLTRERAQAALEAGSPTVTVTAGVHTEVVIDGSPATVAPENDLMRTVGDRTVLEVGGVAIQVTAGAGSDGLTASLRSAEAELASSLTASGAASIEEAEDAFERRRDAQRTIEQARKALKADLRDLEVEGVTARIESLQARAAGYPRDRPHGWPPMPADLDDARRVRDRLAPEQKRAEADATAAAKALAAIESSMEELEAAGRELEIRLASATRSAKLAADRLDAARADAADSALGDAVVAAEAAEAIATAASQAGDTSLTLADPDTVRELIEVAEDAHVSVTEQLGRAESELRSVAAVLEVRGEEGLYDKLEEARGRARVARDQAGKLERRAAAACFLYETLISHREAATRAYVGPLRAQIIKLGKVVFGPSFSVELGEDLRIESRTLDGRTVPFESLSVGTKEQLSLITRLAGSMLVASDGGVPVVFDDTLGHSDEQRLEGMGAVLSLAGRTSQVIVLTCVPDRFRHVGAAKVVRLSDCRSGLAAVS